MAKKVNTFTFKDFRPTILFLVKFIGLYVVGSLLYGWFVTAHYPGPDPVTLAVTNQCAGLLGGSTHAIALVQKPTVTLMLDTQAVVSVYEGCNGLNVMVVFLSFILAFGPYTKQLWWFIPMGLIVVHLANLLRIIGLYEVALHMPNYLYFAHKYLFTAFIYFIVFVLWVWWVRSYAKRPAHG